MESSVRYVTSPLQFAADGAKLQMGGGSFRAIRNDNSDFPNWLHVLVAPEKRDPAGRRSSQYM